MAANILDGYTVLVTAVHVREREELARTLSACGGQFTSSVSLKDPPHVVITRSVKSPKYRALLRAHPHTPVVTPEWLAASAQAGRLQPYDSYRVGPFHGLTVCLSGLSASKKQELATLVVRGGGAHSPALDKKCTHLATNSADSEKYRFAIREGITVVVTRWVEESVEAGWCQDEAAYTLGEGPAGGEGAGQSGGRGSTLARHPAGVLKAGWGQEEETSTLSEPLAPAASCGETFSGGVAPSACAPTDDGLPAQPAPRGPSRLQRTGSVAEGTGQGAGWAGPPMRGSAEVLAAAAAAQQQQRQVAAAAAVLEAQLDWDDATPTFLDSVQLRLLGCSAAESREALGLVRQGAAKRFADWNDGLHHLVVGSDLSAGQAADALEFLSTHRSCIPVNLEWLRQCVAAQQRLEPDGFTVPTSRFSQHRRKLPALEKVEAIGRAAAAEPTLSSGNLASEAPESGPLEGCYFTLAAVRGKEEEAYARQLIQQNGGRVFTDTTLQRITDKSRAFAICPPSLVPTEITQLRSSCPDFRLVEEKQRFTLYWLECSLEVGEPLPPIRGAPLYQPLPYPLPLAGMSSVVACTSVYDPPVRVAIGRTVKVLGGTVTDNMSRKNTHLIIPVAAGIKYEYAASYGVIPVTADWLVDTVQLGRRQPESHYQPRPPAGQPGARLVATATAEHSRGSCGAGPGGPCSQIGITQMPGAAQQPHAAAQQQPQQQRRPPRPAAAEQPTQRLQLVLPPPPGQQLEAAGGSTGGRRPGLRERFRATQAAAAAAGGSGGSGLAQLQNDENVVGQGSNSGTGADDADLLQLGSKQPLTTCLHPAAQQPQRQPQQVQPQRRSALDEAMAGLEGGGKQLSPAPPSSMFEALFGSSPSEPPAAGPANGIGPAADAQQEAAAAQVAAQPPQPQQAPAGRGSCRALRSSSRLRPMEQQLREQEQQAEEEEQQGQQAVEEQQATDEAVAAVVSGSEPQEDVAKAIDSLNHLLGGLPAEAPPRMGTQLEPDIGMHPPPARTRAAGAKRGTSAPAESSLSNGSAGGSRGRAAKRPLTADDGVASGGSGGRMPPPRRSGRGRAAELQQAAAPHMEMSQQVGYADSLEDLNPLVPTRSASLSDNQLLRRRLAATAAGAGLRGGGGAAAAAAARAADPLADLL